MLGAGLALVALLAFHTWTSPTAEALAQAKAETSRSDESKDQPAASGGAAGADSKGKSASRKKRFRPSERITADSAVSFPVDI